MVSTGLRAEFARGDGRIKRKEDERRRKITPSETLFVVNFHEETTKREDLEMLFSPYGELVRIDMKRNYAFVQFRSTEQAQAAKDATNGGKLDQSEIAVEFVARRMGEGGGRDRRRDDYRGPRRDDYRSRRDDYRPRRDDYRPRRRYRSRSRSRSRSPPGYRYDRRRSRSRSPDDRHRQSSSYRRNSRSPGRDYDERRGRGESAGGRGYSSRGYGEEGR
jgi:RNA recognition motif-containing protein